MMEKSVTGCITLLKQYLDFNIPLVMHKHIKILIGITCAALAVFLVFRAKNGVSSPTAEKISMDAPHFKHSARNPSMGHGEGSSLTVGGSELTSPSRPQPLNLPIAPVNEKSLEAPAKAVLASGGARKILSDDDILIAGGVVIVTAKPASDDAKITQLKSIKSDDWKGEANLLVNALRAGEGFEVNHDELLAFISGKDLLGWPEGQRNWIGDELMTALRQDMPQSAFGDLKSIAENTTAPAAMRDYSVQHISHLVTSGVIGKEGADFVWQILEKNDPQTLSTALISLQRLSEQVPDLVSTKQVQAAAKHLKESLDERTRITAESILKK